MADTDNRVVDGESVDAATKNRHVLAFHDNTGRHLFTGGSSVASASTIAVPDDENYFIVTGTTTIAAISAKSTGSVIVVQFSGALTLTHSATFVMPGGVDLSISAGDRVTFHEFASGSWAAISVTSAIGGGPDIKNLLITRASASTITVTADAITLNDGSLIESVSFTVDITASGNNGIDTGSEANNTGYYIYASTASVGFLSTSATAPTGFTAYRLVGWCHNDSSGNLWDFKQTDNIAHADDGNTGAGFLGSGTSASYAPLSPICPSICRIIIVKHQIRNGGFNYGFSLDGTNDWSTGSFVGTHDQEQLMPLNASRQYSYKRTGGSGDLTEVVVGWVLPL